MSSLSGELLMGPVRLRTNAIGAVDERRIGCGVRELVGVAILFAVDHVVQSSPMRCRRGGEEDKEKRSGGDGGNYEEFWTCRTKAKYVGYRPGVPHHQS